MNREILPYEPHLKQLARKLRNESTLSEILLWKRLSGKKIQGYDFHRQKPILSYIVDFYCSELKLAIEIDGVSHDSEEKWKKDLDRQKKLEQISITFLRFSDSDVKQNIDSVVFAIESWIIKNSRFDRECAGHGEHTPNPSREGSSFNSPLERGSRGVSLGDGERGELTPNPSREGSL